MKKYYSVMDERAMTNIDSAVSLEDMGTEYTDEEAIAEWKESWGNHHIGTVLICSEVDDDNNVVEKEYVVAY